MIRYRTARGSERVALFRITRLLPQAVPYRLMPRPDAMLNF